MNEKCKRMKYNNLNWPFYYIWDLCVLDSGIWYVFGVYVAILRIDYINCVSFAMNYKVWRFYGVRCAGTVCGVCTLYIGLNGFAFFLPPHVITSISRHIQFIGQPTNYFVRITMNHVDATIQLKSLLWTHMRSKFTNIEHVQCTKTLSLTLTYKR